MRFLLSLALVLLSRAQDDGDEDDTARLLVRKRERGARARRAGEGGVGGTCNGALSLGFMG